MNDHTIIGSIFGGSAFVVLVACFFSNIEQLSNNNDISTNKENMEKSA